MKMRGWTWILILLPAGLAQAVNTTAAPNDKEWVRSQQGLIGYVEMSQGNLAGPSEPNLASSGPSEGVLGPMWETDANLPAFPLSDPANDDAARQSASGLTKSIDIAANWVNDPHWSLNPRNGPDAGFVNASSQVDLPSFAEIDWIATPLPTAKETSVMVVVVFPALRMLVVIFLVTLLVLRVRRHRPLDQDQQLLQV